VVEEAVVGEVEVAGARAFAIQMIPTTLTILAHLR
jgi:hypothetical protein